MADLQPCPFCGSTTVSVQGPGPSLASSIDCWGCGASGPCIDGCDGREEAGRDWNTRPIEDALTRQRDDLNQRWTNSLYAWLEADEELARLGEIIVAVRAWVAAQEKNTFHCDEAMTAVAEVAEIVSGDECSHPDRWRTDLDAEPMPRAGNFRVWHEDPDTITCELNARFDTSDKAPDCLFGSGWKLPRLGAALTAWRPPARGPGGADE